MPHLVIEHSADIQNLQIQNLQKEIQDIMSKVEGNFDPDQCKCRSVSFAEYLVGNPNQNTSSFIHITLKVLTGRTAEVRKNLSQKIAEFTKIFFTNLNLKTSRCEISVDLVEMDAQTYQKIRLEN